MAHLILMLRLFSALKIHPGKSHLILITELNATACDNYLHSIEVMQMRCLCRSIGDIDLLEIQPSVKILTTIAA